MKKEKNSYWTLFSSTFMLSAFTFGGGYVIVPLMRKKFVEELQWIDEEEMLDLVSIAQSAPGIMAVNTSILIGYRIKGVSGALITVLGTVLPPLIIITIVYYFYDIFRSNQIVKLVLAGMQIGVAAIIMDVVFSMGKTVIKDRGLFGLVMIITIFILAFFFKQINIVFLILGSAIIGVINLYLSQREETGGKP